MTAARHLVLAVTGLVLAYVAMEACKVSQAHAEPARAAVSANQCALPLLGCETLATLHQALPTRAQVEAAIAERINAAVATPPMPPTVSQVDDELPTLGSAQLQMQLFVDPMVLRPWSRPL